MHPCTYVLSLSLCLSRLVQIICCCIYAHSSYLQGHLCPTDSSKSLINLKGSMVFSCSSSNRYMRSVLHSLRLNVFIKSLFFFFLALSLSIVHFTVLSLADTVRLGYTHRHHSLLVPNTSSPSNLQAVTVFPQYITRTQSRDHRKDKLLWSKVLLSASLGRRKSAHLRRIIERVLLNLKRYLVDPI
ncbi:uncharacterized protein FA14DRAFT_34373 [Meira miltonrushii]|uniref:Uncharacterized protein n=1 Tax=Meira miltonrushii TaxID=1280837 RepID=A0A316VB97_9BASI|nr:uncharacterized protein FA14DRAFT_34373 [Meira miltonrushii]PWN34812.1 hypothetical protein FA14DRAFT_34373 [Meira miltonrushii]